MLVFAFVLYFILVLAIGVFFYVKNIKNNSEGEYFLGGRSMGPWVTALSAQASDMSAWLLMGLPGSVLAFGLGQAWIGIGLALGTAANWIFVARRLRRFSAAANDSITLPQYLSNRFVTGGKTLQVISAVIFLVCFTVYVASSFVAGRDVFTSVFPDIGGQTALLIFAAIIILYTFLGGFKAVCWTDFFQGIMMLCALLLVPIAMAATGKFDASFAEPFAEGVKPFGSDPFAASWNDIVSGLGWGLGYFGMPHILVRFMGIKDPKSVKKSAWIACIWVVLSLGAAIAVGILGRTYLLGGADSLAEKLIPASAQQMVFVTVVNSMFPAFVAGILLAAIIAASMSTADSQLLVASSAFSSDFYQPVVRKNKATDAEMLWVGRFVVMIVAFVAFYVAASGLGKPGSWASSIMDMVENAWGLFGSAFGPVVILSLFWRRFNYAGALAGVVGGAVVDVVCLYKLSDWIGGYLYEIVPGFAAGFVFAVLATLLTKKPGAEVDAIFDKATAKDVAAA